MQDLLDLLKPSFNKQLNDIGEDLTNTIKAYLNYNDIKASKELINSIKFSVSKPTALNLNLKIYAEEYFNYIEQGRKPGKFVPIKPLTDWVRDKRLPIEAVYPINYNIFKYGIKPKPILSKIITKNKDEYFNNLKQEYTKIITTYFKNKLNDNK